MKKLAGYILSFIILVGTLISPVDAYGASTLNKKAKPPEIFAETGVLIDATSGTVLYNKKMDSRMYPASITKIMTTLLALENSSLEDMVTFSHYAVFSLEPGAAHISIKDGEQLSMKDTLHGIMLNSANECANAAAEYIGKKTDAYKKKIEELKKGKQEYSESVVAISCFADMMNERAKQAGAKGTHFVNPHGLFDENHYTTPYDMAMITREAIKNDKFLKIESNITYTIGTTNLTDEERYLKNRHDMMRSDESVYYEGIIAGKTGYVDQSGNTLVTVARRNDMTLISVVMKSNTFNVYSDTKALLDYGFNNYASVNISENETKFSLANDGFFGNIGSVFTENSPLLQVNPEGCVILPNGVEFSELKSKIVFGDKSIAGSNSIADIEYYYGKTLVGSTTLDVIKRKNDNAFEFGPAKVEKEKPEETGNKWLTIDLRVVCAVVAGIIVLFGIWKFFISSKGKVGSRRRIRRERYGRRARRRRNKGGRLNTANIHHRHRNRRY